MGGGGGGGAAHGAGDWAGRACERAAERSGGGEAVEKASGPGRSLRHESGGCLCGVGIFDGSGCARRRCIVDPRVG